MRAVRPFFNYCFIAVIMTALFAVTGCSSDKKDDSGQKGAADNESSSTSENDGNREVQIYTLPTPVQIPSLLKINNSVYLQEELLPMNPSQKTHFLRAISLGMYMIDLSYTSINSDKQKSIYYLKTVRTLMVEIGLGSKTNKSLADRFERNIETPDSLSKIILEAYEEGHVYFREHNREGIGLLIISGCFIEGLHLSMQHTESLSVTSLNHALLLQKSYLTNLLRIFALFEYNDEVAEVIGELEAIKKVLDDMGLQRFVPSEEKSTVTPEQQKLRDLLTKKISTLRNRLI